MFTPQTTTIGLEPSPQHKALAIPPGVWKGEPLDCFGVGSLRTLHSHQVGDVGQHRLEVRHLCGSYWLLSPCRSSSRFLLLRLDQYLHAYGCCYATRTSSRLGEIRNLSTFAIYVSLHPSRARVLSRKIWSGAKSGPRGPFLVAKNCLRNVCVIGPFVPKVVLRGAR